MLILLASLAALAQDPPLSLNVLGAGSGLQTAAARTLSANEVWVVADADMVRWPGSEVVVASLKAGDSVEEIVRKDGLVRVRRGLDFGWMPEANVTAQPPVVEEAAVPTGAPGE